MMCADTEEEAMARGLEGGNFFGYSLAHFYVFGEHVPGATNVWEEYIERRGLHGYSPEAAAAALEEERLGAQIRSEEHKAELPSRQYLLCRLLLEKKNT